MTERHREPELMQADGTRDRQGMERRADESCNQSSDKGQGKQFAMALPGCLGRDHDRKARSSSPEKRDEINGMTSFVLS